MSFSTEFKYATILLFTIPILIIVFAFTNNTKLQIIASLFSIILGSALIMFGFWGADFAFGLAIGDIKQQKERGLVRGAKKKVYVPFMRNYTPLEWWNLNWYITFLGCLFLAIGMLVIGLFIGVHFYTIGYWT
jgi:hypothetical protein